ncbi:hypothetical protein [Arcicella rigui]|uniref:Uncharacterized protein n=1 Tax=Arcicella rigui TaxID=797020 RepID=A0ABU5Q5S2_9BACT|nr:hypothetical protein [Arcicella rigui]MEA5137968.1 hypothetical protein [Arcicella rigui]
MTDEELQNIINSFDETTLKEQAIWGIFQYGGGSDESFIKANKEGLTLFALELLKASLESKKIKENPNEKFIHIDCDENWNLKDAETYLQYIEIIDEKQHSNTFIEANYSMFDNVMMYLLMIIGFILLVALWMGFETIFKMLF